MTKVHKKINMDFSNPDLSRLILNKLNNTFLKELGEKPPENVVFELDKLSTLLNAYRGLHGIVKYPSDKPFRGSDSVNRFSIEKDKDYVVSCMLKGFTEELYNRLASVEDMLDDYYEDLRVFKGCDDLLDKFIGGWYV